MKQYGLLKTNSENITTMIVPIRQREQMLVAAYWGATRHRVRVVRAQGVCIDDHLQSRGVWLVVKCAASFGV